MPIPIQSDQVPRRIFTPSSGLTAARTFWRWRIAILIAAVDLVVVGAEIGYWRLPLVGRGGRWFELREFNGFSFGIIHPVLVALATSQTALLALWACFGRGRWVVRWLAAGGGTALVIAILGAVPSRTYKPACIEVLLLAQWIVIAALAVPIRFSRCRLARAAQTTSAKARTRKTQFRLSDLFWCTAAVALLLATGPSLSLMQTVNQLDRVVFGPATDYGVRLGRGVFFAVAAYGAVCGLTAIVTLWAAWRNRRSWLRLLAAAALVWATGRIAIDLVAIFKIHALGDISAYAIQPHACLLWFCIHGGIMLSALLSTQQRDYFSGHDESDATNQDGESNATDEQPPRKLQIVASLVLILPLVATPWLLDELRGAIFGDGDYRRAVDAIAARHGPAAVMHFADFVGVWPRRPLSADDFEYYQRYSTIEGFNFDDGPSDEATWQSLKRWPRLRLLGLGREVTNDDLKHVAELSDLETIWLHSLHVTDAGLEHLERLSNLKSLQTENSPKITDQGVKRLRQALPRALIPRRP